MQISIGHAKNKIVSAAKKCLLHFCLRHATHAYVFESRSRLLQRLKGRCHDTQLSKVSWEWFPPVNLKGGMKDVKDSFSFKFATFLKSPRICKTRKKERDTKMANEERERKRQKSSFPFPVWVLKGSRMHFRRISPTLILSPPRFFPRPDICSGASERARTHSLLRLVRYANVGVSSSRRASEASRCCRRCRRCQRGDRARALARSADSLAREWRDGRAR